MNSTLIKTSPNLVCKAGTGMLCEHCLSGMVISTNPLVVLFQDFHYFIGSCSNEVLSTDRKTAFKFFVDHHRNFALNRVEKHSHELNQQICERCIGALSSSGFLSIDEVREWILCGFRAVGLLCELAGIFFIGIFMIFMTFCPNIMRVKTHEENAELDRVRDEKDKELARIHAAKDAEYAKTLDDLYAPDRQPSHRTDRDALLEDDQEVSKLNHTIRAVEDGKADPREAEKLARELMDRRREESRKDERRHELWEKMRAAEVEAQRTLADALRKEKEGDSFKATELYEKAGGLIQDAKGFYLEFKSV